VQRRGSEFGVFNTNKILPEVPGASGGTAKYYGKP